MSVSWRMCSTVFSANSARTSSIRSRWAASSRSSSGTVRMVPRKISLPADGDGALAGDGQRLSVAEQVEDRGLGRVDEADAGPGHHQRPGVRVLPVRGRRGVHHRRHPGGDQLLRRDPVHVHVVDHRDIARLQAFHQMLRAPAETRRALDRDGTGPGSAATPEQGGQATTTGGCHEIRLCERLKRSQIEPGYPPGSEPIRTNSGGEELSGVLGGGLVGGLAAEHAADLLDHALAGEALDASPPPARRRCPFRGGSGRRRGRRPGAGG